jgi:hypothetical protein
MKTVVLCCVLMFTGMFSSAQKDSLRRSHHREQAQDEGELNSPPQAIYLNIGGASPFVSFQYDRRLRAVTNGFGYTIGAGYMKILGVTVFSVPVAANYLFGQRTHFFEVAAGVTYVTASVDLIANAEVKNSGSAFLYTLNAGYRYHPTNGGYFFRVGVGPLFFTGDFSILPYLGVGYKF